MKPPRRSGFFFLALMSTLSLHHSVKAQVSETTLSNGLRVIVQPSHTVGIVSVDAWVRAGTSREDPKHPGVAHFLEHVLFKGTPTHPTEETIDAAVEDLGGSFNAATSYDWAHFYATVPATGFSATLDVLADVLQHASISSAMVDDERPIIMSEVGRNDADPAQVLDHLARGLVYGPGNPYGRSITGDEDAVHSITRDQIAQFYHGNYVPKNMTLVVTGDVTAAQVQSAAARDFGTWKPALPTDTPNDPAPAPGTGIRRQIVRREASQSYLVMAFRAPSVKDTPDVWTMDVLLTLLGQGGNNRLDTALHRKAHLVSEIGADFLTQHDPGLLTVSATFPTGNLESVEAAVLTQIKLLRDEPVPTDEVEAAKRSLISAYLFDSETVSGRSDTLGFYDTIDTYEYDTHYLDRCKLVTAADVQRMARKYLTPDSYALVALVPRTDAMTAASLSSHATLRTARSR